MPGPWARHSGGGCCPLLAPVHFPPAPPLQASPVHPEAASWGQGFRIRGRDPGAVHPGARGSPAPAIDKFLFSEYLARPILGQLGNPRTHLCCLGDSRVKALGFQRRRGNWALLPAVPWEPCLPREARGAGVGTTQPSQTCPLRDAETQCCQVFRFLNSATSRFMCEIHQLSTVDSPLYFFK